MQKIHPFLWFDGQAEEAAKLYCSLFPNSKMGKVTRYPPGSYGGMDGQVMTVEFELSGQPITGLNGGPAFKFNEAVSFSVACEDQAEVDRYWNALTADGGEESQCGWLKDRFGFSWQIVPTVLAELVGDPDPEKARRANQAMLGMKKLDIAALKAAHAGV
ncbi:MULTISPECIES: VOC family protein [Phenylobacterium]|uniref:3-demethylubiquinone-9 3-methyltransferase (Glyoxalase superfamily) n=1 Tax=Phenylobacterium koreense TaxID=266125 RepID=A0ABV2EMG0_9CAUL